MIREGEVRVIEVAIADLQAFPTGVSNMQNRAILDLQMVTFALQIARH